jgi:Autographiviridae tail tubular protein Gp11
MALATTPTTELEAVNMILSAIGEAPVNSLGSGLPDAEVAENVLSEINRTIQSQGWNFNTELKWSLVPDVNGELHLPANCLRVDDTFLVQQTDKDYVLRGSRLYDRVNHTYAIDETIEVDMVVLLNFSELPETARSYIAIRSARVFQDRVLGSDQIHSYTLRDEEEARVRLHAHKLKTGDYNFRRNASVSRYLDRRIGTPLR